MAARKDAAETVCTGDYLMTAIAMNAMTLARERVIARPATEPLFHSAHEALVFALNFSMQQYDRPLMNRVASGDLPGGGRAVDAGKGLSGLDGAGQAGMIHAELDRLSPLHKAVLIVGAAPAQIPCLCTAGCCSGWKANPEWAAALSDLNSIAAAAALSGCVSNGRLRSALIQRLFGAKVSFSELAERHDVSLRTVEGQSAKLKRWLFGKGGKGDQMGLHPAAYQELEARMTRSGLIGGAEDS